MFINIFGFKMNINLELLILIGIIYIILLLHIIGGCSYFRHLEGLENMDLDSSGNIINKEDNVTNKEDKKDNVSEGFSGANINYGQSSQYDLNDNTQILTSSWNAQDLSVVPGKELSDGVKQFLSREPQQVPLPNNEMLLFNNTPFKPECCPNTYSNSMGCACMTGNQYNYLQQRGGNNVPYSTF